MRALANAIQRAHKDYKNQTWLQYNIYFICSMLQLSELGFLITEHSVLIVSVHELAVGTLFHHKMSANMASDFIKKFMESAQNVVYIRNHEDFFQVSDRILIAQVKAIC